MEVTLVEKSIINFNENSSSVIYELTFENTDKWAMGVVLNVHTLENDSQGYRVGESYMLETVLIDLGIIKE